MQYPGIPAVVFLIYLLGFLPWISFRSARKLRVPREGTPDKALPSREMVWIGTLVSLGLLLWMSWLAGSSFDYPFFAVPTLGVREIGAAALALAVCLALRSVSRATRTEDERRKMTVYLLAPRTGRELTLWAATVVMASVSEEIAYRGVGMAILWHSLGNPWIAALVSATAFALAHWTQGWKSALVVFGIALAMHGLVAFTGTLVLAMIVHAVYDYVAGYRILLEARRFDREASAGAS
jgi:membrane protease YdiL (CAAX protease family)